MITKLFVRKALILKKRDVGLSKSTKTDFYSFKKRMRTSYDPVLNREFSKSKNSKRAFQKTQNR